jgi:NAD(P)-dependent dehydrogenase (short-subunit alcohol dehydrogenase family)
VELGLRGKTVLITGGNRNLGLEIARWFAREGADIAICARDAAALEGARKELVGLGADVLTSTADLFVAADCRRVVDETVARFGGLDVLVNNASTDVSKHPTLLEDVTDEQLLERVMGKALGAIRVSRAALPHLVRSGAGRIVFIGGDSARTTVRAFGDGAPSSAQAAGLGNALLVNFAKRLSNQVAGDGIVVNVVHPSGGLKGDRYANRLAARATANGVSIEEEEAATVAGIPIKRAIDGADIAPLVVFLASERVGAITGQSIAVDGGRNAAVVY